MASAAPIPPVGLGLWKIAKPDVPGLVREALRVGYRHLDSACDYGNEVEVAARHRRFDPLMVVVTRPLPILAEAAALMAGATGMPARTFLAAAAPANLAIAFAWSLAGALGRDADSLQWVAIAALAVPAAVAAVVAVRRQPSGGIPAA
jgi:membrane protein DedA with SNARE-associated domain